jgi:hypothetical protein
MGPGAVTLYCSRCGDAVYSATPDTYNRADARRAADQHDARCRNRPLAPQAEEAHEVSAR